MIYLDLDDLLYIAERAMGEAPVVRDAGLLESAAARPRTELFGTPVYPTLALKAAALTLSLVGNHALVDGNKRLGLAGLIAFLGVNGYRLTWTNDEAHDLIVNIAAGKVTEVVELAAILDASIRTR